MNNKISKKVPRIITYSILTVLSIPSIIIALATAGYNGVTYTIGSLVVYAVIIIIITEIIVAIVTLIRKSLNKNKEQ